MDWITSWPSVIFGSVGLLACVIGLLTEQFRPEPKPRPKRLRPEDIRQRIKKRRLCWHTDDAEHGKNTLSTL